jgi:uncharacterized protein (TIGR02271 family)
MGYEKIVTVYDTADLAEKAAGVLKAAGYPASDISVLNKNSLSKSDLDELGLKETGLWRRLFGTSVLDHEATVYGRALSTGGALLSLRVPETEVARAMGILNTHNPVDVLRRAATVGAAPPTLVAQVPPSPAPTTKPIVTTDKAEVLRLAEEQLNVGKRLVEEGTTRIRRFVSEKPVEAKVTLHEEHAEVMRRAASDPDFIKDVDWADKTIEIRETDEKAVVNKTTRIAEEVVIRKEGSDRTETVRDTVRRQEVTVEKLAPEPISSKK